MSAQDVSVASRDQLRGEVVTLFVGEVKWTISLQLLAVHSPVFERMFSQAQVGTLEATSRAARLSGVSADVVAGALNWLYFGNDLGCDTKALLVFADMYDMGKLKGACEMKLALDEGQPQMELLRFAEDNRARRLKVAVMEKLGAGGGRFLDAADYGALKAERPALAFELTEFILRHTTEQLEGLKCTEDKGWVGQPMGGVGGVAAMYLQQQHAYPGFSWTGRGASGSGWGHSSPFTSSLS